VAGDGTEKFPLMAPVAETVNVPKIGAASQDTVAVDAAPPVAVPVNVINCPAAPVNGKVGLKVVKAAETGATITTAATSPAIEASENILKILLIITNTSQVNHADFSCTRVAFYARFCQV
jgi:hypothetical protein